MVTQSYDGPPAKAIRAPRSRVPAALTGRLLAGFSFFDADRLAYLGPSLSLHLGALMQRHAVNGVFDLDQQWFAGNFQGSLATTRVGVGIDWEMTFGPRVRIGLGPRGVFLVRRYVTFADETAGLLGARGHLAFDLGPAGPVRLALTVEAGFDLVLPTMLTIEGGARLLLGFAFGARGPAR